MSRLWLVYYLFFFNDTATTEIYTLSLHDALPISFPLVKATTVLDGLAQAGAFRDFAKLTKIHVLRKTAEGTTIDRKSTRLNSSHSQISYAVFCLKKKIIVLSDKITHKRDRDA